MDGDIIQNLTIKYLNQTSGRVEMKFISLYHLFSVI